MEKKTKVTALERQRAAQAWCQPNTKNKVMDVELCEAFAEILHDIWTKPWLGNATTGELLDEIRARVDCLCYKTYEPEPATAAGCRVPPAGWECSREPNHTGPCAARPIDQPPIDNAHVEAVCEQFSTT